MAEHSPLEELTGLAFSGVILFPELTNLTWLFISRLPSIVFGACCCSSLCRSSTSAAAKPHWKKKSRQKLFFHPQNPSFNSNLDINALKTQWFTLS
jgi:hypothetical protein